MCKPVAQAFLKVLLYAVSGALRLNNTQYNFFSSSLTVYSFGHLKSHQKSSKKADVAAKLLSYQRDAHSENNRDQKNLGEKYHPNTHSENEDNRKLRKFCTQYSA